MSKRIEEIEVEIRWKKSEDKGTEATGEQETVTCAVGVYPEGSEDDHIFYWFDDWDRIIGDHPDFKALSYEK